MVEATLCLHQYIELRCFNILGGTRLVIRISIVIRRLARRQ